VATPADPLVAALVDIVGPEHVLTDPDVRAGYETDWTGRWRGTARAVVRPEHRGGVARVLQVCAAHGVAVVPQGGNTGLVGGSIPHNGEVVLNLRRIEEVQHVGDDKLHAGAGATLAAVHHAAGAVGRRFGLDLASRDSATIGGMIATNAGGIHVVRYGRMRQQVLGIEAVLADGSCVRSDMDSSCKENGGYDVGELLVGSEGTLAVVTHALLRLVPEPRHRVCALLGLDTVDDAIELLPMLQELQSLEAVEFMFARGVSLVAMRTGLPLPFDPLPPVLLLVACAAPYDPIDELASVVRHVPQAAVGIERDDRERLWAYRERHTEAISTLGVPRKLDVHVPLHELAQFISNVDDAVDGEVPGSVYLFGHLAEGTVHVNVVGPDEHLDFAERYVLEEVLICYGSVSAEHGIGVAKKQWLARARHRSDLAAMRRIKDALDPTGLLNPNVLFGDPGPMGRSRTAP
jgi:FAD/FMN-containing dehydrogenase